jgi:hypothetical protein
VARQGEPEPPAPEGRPERRISSMRRVWEMAEA